jgi:hypothetical protein
MSAALQVLKAAGGRVYHDRVYFNHLGRFLPGGYDDRWADDRARARCRRYGWHTNPVLFFDLTKNRWYCKKLTKDEKKLIISKIMEKIVPEGAVLVCAEKEEV